jgi:hypothetical protein
MMIPTCRTSSCGNEFPALVIATRTPSPISVPSSGFIGCPECSSRLLNAVGVARRTITDMSTGQLVGYVGGLAVALGVGCAVLVSAPTASAETSSASSPSTSHSGIAKSGRAPQRTTTVGAVKRAPLVPHRDGRPAGRALRAAAAAQDVLSDNNTHNVTLSYATDPTTGKPRTLVSVVDNSTGDQVGTTVTLDGYSASSPVVTTDGRHAFVATTYNDTDNKPHILVAEIETTTGTQLGFTLDLIGTLSNLALSAKDTRAVVTTTWNRSDTGDISEFGGTVVAVLDSATGVNTGGIAFLDGVVSNFVPSADNKHVLITTSNPWAPGYPGTSVVVINTVTGFATGPVKKFQGDATWTPPLLLSDDGARALIMTIANRDTTVLRVVDTTTGYQVGDDVNVVGYADGPAIMTGDGIHVLLRTFDYYSGTENEALTVFDTTTSSQTGTSLWIHGNPYGAPLLTPDGKHAVIITTVKDSDYVSTMTGVAILDTTTGRQVGTTLSILGGVLSSPTLGAGGIVIRTTAGLQTTVDPIAGAARTVPVAFPWGFDTEAVSRAITHNRVVQAVGSALLTFGFFGGFFGLMGLIGLGVALEYVAYIGEAIAYHLGLPIATATPW